MENMTQDLFEHSLNVYETDLRLCAKHLEESIGWLNDRKGDLSCEAVLMGRASDAVELMKEVEMLIYRYKNMKAIEAMKELW